MVLKPNFKQLKKLIREGVKQMKRGKIYLLIFSIIFILSLVWEHPLFLQSAYAEPSITIIANNSVQENSISAKDLKKIYLGKKTAWANKSRIIFIVCGYALIVMKDTKRRKLKTKIKDAWKKLKRK